MRSYNDCGDYEFRLIIIIIIIVIKFHIKLQTALFSKLENFHSIVK